MILRVTLEGMLFGKPDSTFPDHALKPRPAFRAFDAADPEKLRQRSGRFAHAHLLFVGHLLQAPSIAFVILTAARATAAPIGA